MTCSKFGFPARRGFAALVLALATILVLAGCSRDPNVRKQKYLDSGKRYYEKEKYREAAIQYLNAIQVDARYAEAHFELAQCYLKMGIYNAAYQELLRTVDVQPDNLKAQIELGNLLLAAREFKQAQEKAQFVLQKDPNNVDGHILLANSYAVLENLPESLKEMQKAIELAPDRPRTYLNMAFLQLGAQQAAAAEESFKKAIALEPKSIPARLALGNFYQQQRRWAEAEQEFRSAAQANPKDHLSVAALARLYLSQGNRAQAEQFLRQAMPGLQDNPEGYRLLGDFYFSLGDIDKALSEFDSLRQAHPQDLRAKKNYIQLLILRDRLDEATRLNDEILKDNPKDVEGLIHRGQVLNRQGRPNDAIQVLEAAIKSEADNSVAHYHLGLSFSMVGNLARAETEWREAVRLRPNMPAAQQALAGVALRKGDMDMLRQTADQLIAAEPFFPGGYALRAIALGARGDRAGAEAELKRAIAMAPDHPLGYTRLAGLRFVTRNYAEAEKLFEQALQKDPSFLEALQGLVALSAVQKQLPKALARVDAQIARVPDNSAFYTVRGQILTDMKDLEKAEAAFEKAVALNKNNVDAYLMLGQVQVVRGSRERAAASYERSIQQNPRDVRPYILLGALEESRANWARARELYEKALQVEPSHPLAANNLAYLLLEHGGNADVALTHAQNARRGMPESPNAADTLAWVYYHKGAYGLAIGLLEEAVKKVPQNPTYHYHLGLAYQKTNDRAKARMHLQRALEIDPNYKAAAEIRKALSDLGG